jgi:hypothetical protein
MSPANLKCAIGLFLTVSVLAAALLLLAGPAPATAQSSGTDKEASKKPAKQTNKWPGEWLFEGKEDQPCAIFQHGRVLLLVNEDGELATGRVSGADTLAVLKGSWEEGLTGTLSDDGKTISWGNGTTWKRP